MILHVFGEPVHVADDIADGVYSRADVGERLIAGGAGGYPAGHYFMEAPVETVCIENGNIYDYLNALFGDG